MPRRLTNRFRFLLERLMLRGALARLLVIGLAMGLLVLVAGTVVWNYSAAFGTAGEAYWWAFLRLTDPGYLGDDEGALVRTVSTFLTVSGFVLFVGALIAILTQWLDDTIEGLEGGYTPVALRRHIVVLGWTNRTAAVVQELVLAEGRLRRFLRRHDVAGLRVAVLAEGDPAGHLRELRERLGDHFNERQIVIRTGTPLRREHLRRVDFLNAAAVLLPGADFVDEHAGSDTRVIKTLLSMASGSRAPSDLPLVVAEVTDEDKAPIARRAYGGRIETLTSDAIISRLIAQNVRYRGLSHVYDEVLTHGRGNELYVREVPELVGTVIQSLHGAFPEAVLLGVARPRGESFRSLLHPGPEETVEPGDRLVLLARSYEATARRSSTSKSIEIAADASAPPSPAARRILLLGWNHRVPALLHEFDAYAGHSAVHVDVLSLVSIEERKRLTARYGVRPDRVEVGHVEGDYTALADLRAMDPASYTNTILVGSNWLESGAESDARTILGHLLLRELLPADRTEVITELLDPENLALLQHRSTEVLISPRILSHMLAQVLLRPELRAVFDELFGPGGADISFVPAAQFGLEGSVPFVEVQRAAAARGAIALGVRLAARGTGPTDLRLNPDRSRPIPLGDGDDLVLLARSAA